MQQLQPLRRDLIAQGSNAGQIAAGPAQAGNQPKCDRIGPGHKYDRNGCRRRLRRSRARNAAERRNDVDLPASPFGGQPRQSIVVALRPPIFNRQVLAFDIAGLAQACSKCAHVRRILIAEPATEITEDGSRRLLCASSQRPNYRAAEKCDELAPSHSITSLASASSVGGTARPSAFAVLRLMISSSLVASWTGRSPGFSPLRTRPV